MTLRAERADLTAERDPRPADPSWLAAERAGEPLWRCVEFTGDLPGTGQAGVEGAAHGRPHRRRALDSGLTHQLWNKNDHV